MDSEKVLVKLYILTEPTVWEEAYTGYLFFYELEADKTEGPTYKLVMAEDCEADNVLCEFDLDPAIKYGRQDETIIVWEEDEKEFAISFQSALNCQITFETIEKSLKIMNSEQEIQDKSARSPASDADDLKMEELGEFPEINHENLPEIARYFGETINSQIRREQLSLIVERTQTIPRFVELFRQSEDLEDIQALLNIYVIIKSIFSFSKFSVFEVLLNDDYLLDIIGILEYNSAHTERIHHRKIVESSKMIEIIPFSNPTLRDLIIHTHRLQYLQDIVLPTPSIFEERGSFLSSFVFFRKNEIMEMIFEDKNFLSELFSLLNEEITDENVKKNFLKFIVEICNFSRILQAEQKEMFMSKLLNYDVLNCLEKLKDLSGCDLKVSVVDVLFRIADTHPDVVRQGLLSSSESRSNLLFYLCTLIIKTPDTNNSLLAVQVMKVILDISINIPKELEQKTVNNQFLTSFYTEPINALMAPLYSYTLSIPLIEKSFTLALAIENILEILLICVSCHTYHIKNYLFKYDTLKNIATLVSSKFAFLAHGAIRVLRRTLSNSDEFYSRYLSRELILDSVFDVLVDHRKNYDVVHSAIIELFEFLRISNNRALCVELVERRRLDFESITFVTTFKKLVTFVDLYLSERESKVRSSSFLVRPSSLFASLENESFSKELEDSRQNSWIEEESLDDLCSASSPSDRSSRINNSSLATDVVLPDFPPIQQKFNDQDLVMLRPKINNTGIKISLKRSSPSFDESPLKHVRIFPLII
ncbi:hypothetical protein MXB_1747 [Myxobolus squamalis]|nr:hypothetical protein MXB_1747 [Myxobolus squamalis]